jgi:hypothetical protein
MKFDAAQITRLARDTGCLAFSKTFLSQRDVLNPRRCNHKLESRSRRQDLANTLHELKCLIFNPGTELVHAPAHEAGAPVHLHQMVADPSLRQSTWRHFVHQNAATEGGTVTKCGNKLQCRKTLAAERWQSG